MKEINIRVHLHPTSWRPPEPFVSETQDVGRNGRRCECGKSYSVHFKPDTPLQSFVGAMKMAAEDAMKNQGLTRPIEGHLALYVIVVRPRPQDHHSNNDVSQPIRESKLDSLPMVTPYLHMVYLSVFSALNGIVFTDRRQVRRHSYQDTWGDSDEVIIKAKRVSTGDIDTSFKQLDLFDLEV